MKHLSNKEITNYFLGALPLEKSIKAGIHIDECYECFSKAELLNSRVAAFEKDMDSLSELPKMIVEATELEKKEHIQPAIRDRLISLIQKQMNKASAILRNKFEETLIRLKDPAFQLTPFTTLIDELNLDLEMLLQKGKVSHSKGKTVTEIPGKVLEIKKVNNKHLECKIEAHPNELPTIFSPSLEKGVEIVDFKNIPGTSFFAAIIPHDSSDKHYLLHKSKTQTKSRKK